MQVKFSNIIGWIGVLAGAGLGGYGFQNNFNPVAHQAESMSDQEKYCMELLNQTGIIYLDIVILGGCGKIVGKILDAAIVAISEYISRGTVNRQPLNGFSIFATDGNAPENSSPTSILPIATRDVA